MIVKIKKINQNAFLPEYKTLYSSGADLYACIDNKLTVKNMEIMLIPTGISIELPPGFEAQVRPRSGLAARGIILPNSPGTIDSDYRGEIKVIVMNLSGTDFTINRHDRIAQLIIQKVEKAEFTESSALSETARGEGGFGSTGIKKLN
jgi:dUTP pyrophosphatase